MTDDVEPFVLELAQALHRYGMPAYRIEDAMRRVGARLRVELAVFSVPTGLTIGLGPLAEQRVRLMRVQPGAISLARVAELSELIEDFVAGATDAPAARARLMEIEREPPLHGPLATIAAFGLASAASAAFFHASRGETIASVAIGLLVGSLAIAAAHSERVARLFEVLAAALAAALAGVVHAIAPSIANEVVTLAAIIVLVPGYSVTVALNELAAGHLSSGTARFGGALTTMLLLGCGTAIGAVAAHAIGPLAGGMQSGPSNVAALPDASEWVALLCAPIAFKVLFQARHRDLVWIIVASAIAYVGMRCGARIAGPLLGAGLGALVLGVASNVLARVRKRPSAITAVPGLLVLVPGSVGFRGVASFFEHDVAQGAEPVFRMLAIATAIVCGLLLASVVVSSRRSL